MSEEPTAVVRMIDGQMVLDDPEALAVVKAVEKHNCINTFALNAERVLHFANRIKELGRSTSDVVIVIINVDDPHGEELAEILMPGNNWQEYRDRGEIPFARGLATYEGVQSFIEFFDQEAAHKMEQYKNPELAVAVVIDRGVAEVFEAWEAKTYIEE